ncbi:MAG: flagellar hook-basal body complex protein FliE [bacterium]|nr:flagellar hook-basal body complex protein FliE [bacterium]
MPNPVSGPGGLPPVKPVSPASGAPAGEKVTSQDFKSVLLDNLQEVNRLQGEADQGVQRLLSGETDNVAEVFAAVNKAGIAFDLLMEIRNKLQDAYRDIQQMRV